MLKKTIAFMLALSLVFSMAACGSGKEPPEQSGSIVSGSEVLIFSSSQEEKPSYPPESPEAVPETESSSSKENENSSSSSSQQPASSSEQESSSSSSQAPSSSSSQASSVASRPVSSSESQEEKEEPEEEWEEEQEEPESQSRPSSPVDTGDEVRAMWISYLELGTMLTGKSRSQFAANIREACETCADFGLNTIILQVRPYGDAIYPSDYFPGSYLFDGKEKGVGEVPFDALEVAVEEAHAAGLRLEAWINPYRVRTSSARALSSDNPAAIWLDEGSDAVVKMGEVISYNPGSEEAQDLIVDGVREIVENYQVDGIHFDDYFYPTTDTAFDSEMYSDYKSGGGTQSLAAWRRSNVTQLVEKVYSAVKSVDSSATFGISPQGNNSNNLNSQYVDVAEIISLEIVDYVCPQMYFGFKNSGCPYQSTIESFNKMAKGTSVKIYVGLATYKFGNVDTWAGSGKNEWVDSTDLLARQVEAARELSEYGGFVLYRYDSTFNYKSFYSSGVWDQVETELDNLRDVL